MAPDSGWVGARTPHGGDKGAVPCRICRKSPPVRQLCGQPTYRGTATGGRGRPPGAAHCPQLLPGAPKCLIVLEIGADYADLFEVKEARIRRRWEESREANDEMLTIRGSWQDVGKGTAIHVPGADISGNTAQYRVLVPAHGHWSTILTVLPTDDGDHAPAFTHSEGNSLSPRDRRRREWVAKIPVLQVANRSVERTLRRSYDDLGALRIEDPDHPERVVVAAGAPWFMALFGRDSLWASVMAMPVDPSLALGTLQTLADRQGTVVDP